MGRASEKAVATNRIRGKASKGARGKERRARELDETLRLEADRMRGPLEARAKQTLADFRIPLNDTTMSLALNHARLLDLVALAAAAVKPTSGLADMGRALGGIRMLEQERKGALQQLLDVGERFRQELPAPSVPKDSPAAPTARAPRKELVDAAKDWDSPIASGGRP